MATHKIWKLKFNISKAGLAFRWGDGEIQRFPFGLKSGEGFFKYDERRRRVAKA